ncbi:MAG TPA: hypothetical protein VH370_26855 [Humisphaera sp.]|jgi:hypothetical protein|nr:hypothetical protein [Humisphaera sp.]
MPVPLTDPTAEPQTLDEVRDWHGAVAEALLAHRAEVLNAIRGGLAVARRFSGMTEADIDGTFDAQRRELDRLTVLNLVASAEASIKLDFFRRVRGKLKDPLARAYRNWHKSLSGAKQLRPDFDVSGILDVLRNGYLPDKNILGRFRECLRPRHWIGHGRYWGKPIEVDALDAEEVYDRARELLAAIPP